MLLIKHVGNSDILLRLSFNLIFLIDKKISYIFKVFIFNWIHYIMYILWRTNMSKFLKENSRPIIVQLIACLVLIALSCVSLIFSVWIIIVNMTICSILSIGVLILFLVSKKAITPEGAKLTFLLFTFLRYFLMLIGLGVSVLLVFLTMSSEADTKRYLLTLITTFPFAAVTISIMIGSKE